MGRTSKLFCDEQIEEVLKNNREYNQNYLIELIKYLRDEFDVSSDAAESYRIGMIKIKEALFGNNWMDKWNIYKPHDQQIIDEINRIKRCIDGMDKNNQQVAKRK